MNLGQLARGGFRRAPGAAIEEARDTFKAAHCILAENFLERQLRDWIVQDLDAAPFRPRVGRDEDFDEEKPVDERLDDATKAGALLVAFNDPDLFAAVEQVTGCGRIGSFSGVVYRMIPGRGHMHPWHSDLDGNRLAAISVNLSPRGYNGGRLQIADAASTAIVHEIGNTGFGDAVIFELSDAVVHRVTEVTAGDPKISFAGWFMRAPTYRDWVRRAAP
jgi:2-oxoglutarate-Fe(II)-dependent oxygenase superfamily protein